MTVVLGFVVGFVVGCIAGFIVGLAVGLAVGFAVESLPRLDHHVRWLGLGALMILAAFSGIASFGRVLASTAMSLSSKAAWFTVARYTAWVS